MCPLALARSKYQMHTSKNLVNGGLKFSWYCIYDYQNKVCNNNKLTYKLKNYLDLFYFYFYYSFSCVFNAFEVCDEKFLKI